MLRLENYTWTWKKYNVTTVVCNIIIALLMFIAIGSNEWFIVKKNTSFKHNYNNNDNLMYFLKNIDKVNEFNVLNLSTFNCNKIGARNFWKKLKFGELIDENNKTHITTFFGLNEVAIDCITPVTASIFYSLSSFYSNNGFIGWLVQNNILDMCIITLLIFILFIVTCAKEDIQNTLSNNSIKNGGDYYLFVIAIFIGILSIILAFKKSWNLRQRQRKNNQRLMSACTLRSLRDVITRPQTGHSADHYERYLLSRDDGEISTTTNILTTCNENNDHN
ncbi:Hypothetical protein SRAE_X000183300 [Strongyloides ratti]|uniref:Uncharacterized protein n=1 Tax=Strongyloides ratti TaxID=34506 RepID=A0A090KXY4_STRRB|nr:Hypothetical protein SRAE_X000183300 [Strongyloides ratti]CEF60093.1 Hypothetical protein SRAE_X000183300 [Strongyloides ratti]